MSPILFYGALAIVTLAGAVGCEWVRRGMP